MLKSDEELFDETMEDVDDILDGKKPRKRINKRAQARKSEERQQTILGTIIVIIGMPFALVFWFLWEFVPSYGVLVMISLFLAFPITHGVNFFVPDLLDFKHVWGALSGVAFVWILWPILSKEIF